MVLTPSHNRFNVRVYGILMHEGKILVNEEHIKEQSVLKFPGGGLDFGEGTHDCLRREWAEELGLAIEVGNHFYTTDFYQPSAFDRSQVISIYYFVSCGVLPAVFTNHVPNERSFWMDTSAVCASAFTLPIDKVVGGLLEAFFAK